MISWQIVVIESGRLRHNETMNQFSFSLYGHMYPVVQKQLNSSEKIGLPVIFSKACQYCCSTIFQAISSDLISSLIIKSLYLHFRSLCRYSLIISSASVKLAFNTCDNKFFGIWPTSSFQSNPQRFLSLAIKTQLQASFPISYLNFICGI